MLKIYQDEDGLYLVDHVTLPWHKYSLVANALITRYRTYGEAMEQLEFLRRPKDYIDIHEMIEEIVEFDNLHPGVKHGKDG